MFGFSTSAAPASVVINQKVGQSDPATTSPIVFTAVFSSPIDPATFTVSDISTTGSTAAGITVNSITEVAPNNGTTFEVSISATGAGTVVPTIPAPTYTYSSSILATTGGLPNAIVLDSAGNVYTSNQADDTVTKITPGGISSVFGTTESSPYAITIDSAGNIYTANQGSANVTKITPSGVSTIFASIMPLPFDIAIDSAGNIYTANAGTSNVSKIAPDGSPTIFGSSGPLPYGIIADPAGNIYTANLGSSNITKITPDGVSSILGTTGASPHDITIDSLGNLYTSDFDANTVTKITPDGVSSTFGTTGAGPEGITVDIFNNVYTTNRTANSVTKITPAGVSTVIGGTDVAPQDIAVDNLGNVYTANINGSNVTKITATAVGNSGVVTLAGLPNTASVSSDNSVTFALPPDPDPVPDPVPAPVVPVAPVRSTSGGSGYASPQLFQAQTGNSTVSVPFVPILPQTTPQPTPTPVVPKTPPCSACKVLAPISKNKRNSLVEVNKLRTFLNTYENANLVLLGGYNAQDIAAVNKFQLKYKTKILSPYGLTKPTGVVGKNMITQINRIVSGK